MWRFSALLSLRQVLPSKGLTKFDITCSGSLTAAVVDHTRQAARTKHYCAAISRPGGSKSVYTGLHLIRVVGPYRDFLIVREVGIVRGDPVTSVLLDC